MKYLSTTVVLTILIVGCSDLKDIKKRRKILTGMAQTNALTTQLSQELPGQWVIYEKGTFNYQEFENFLFKKNSPDLAKIKQSWMESDQIFYHTTESVVTLVFAKSNRVHNYYLGVQ